MLSSYSSTGSDSVPCPVLSGNLFLLSPSCIWQQCLRDVSLQNSGWARSVHHLRYIWASYQVWARCHPATDSVTEYSAPRHCAPSTAAYSQPGSRSAETDLMLGMGRAQARCWDSVTSPTLGRTQCTGWSSTTSGSCWGYVIYFDKKKTTVKSAFL